MLCADYEDYIRVQEQVGDTYLVRSHWSYVLGQLTTLGDAATDDRHLLITLF